MIEAPHPVEPRLLGDAGQPASKPAPPSAVIVESQEYLASDLAEMLRSLGLEPVIVTSGAEALATYRRGAAGIYFLGVELPDMDGFELARQIKEIAGERFLPVILLASSNEPEQLRRCSESVADDFVAQPLSLALLRARISVMKRVCNLQSAVSERKRALSDKLDRERLEQELAERVLSRAVTERNVVMEHLGVEQRSAAIFSGDIVLSQHMPDGTLRILLGDFTGHGLAAAVGALPVADAFHAMTRKGVSDGLMLAELNRKLYHLLPADRFMAACLVTIPANCQELRWWNGGMPSGWLRTANGLRELTAHALPLGILPELPFHEASRRLRLQAGDRLLIMSDGILEAHDAEGRMFMAADFERILNGWECGQSILPSLFQALDEHSQGVEQADDISVLEVPIKASLFGRPAVPSDALPLSGWTIEVELEDERLQVQPTVESLLKPLGLADGVHQHIAVLETILMELYSNALEHGVLRLDSSLKSTPEGFNAFYRERAKRLSEDCVGKVSIRIVFEPTATGGCVRMRVRDSGNGFEEEEIRYLERDLTRPWGRGIPLLRKLCDSVAFQGNGSQAEVVYRW